MGLSVGFFKVKIYFLFYYFFNKEDTIKMKEHELETLIGHSLVISLWKRGVERERRRRAAATKQRKEERKEGRRSSGILQILTAFCKKLRSCLEVEESIHSSNFYCGKFFSHLHFLCFFSLPPFSLKMI